jgi:hypothetical protein
MRVEMKLPMKHPHETPDATGETPMKRLIKPVKLSMKRLINEL